LYLNIHLIHSIHSIHSTQFTGADKKTGPGPKRHKQSQIRK